MADYRIDNHHLGRCPLERTEQDQLDKTTLPGAFVVLNPRGYEKVLGSLGHFQARTEPPSSDIPDHIELIGSDPTVLQGIRRTLGDCGVPIHNIHTVGADVTKESGLAQALQLCQSSNLRLFCLFGANLVTAKSVTNLLWPRMSTGDELVMSISQIGTEGLEAWLQDVGILSYASCGHEDFGGQHGKPILGSVHLQKKDKTAQVTPAVLR